MRNKLFIGIDNGKHGAIALINLEGDILDAFKYNELEPTLLYDKLSANTDKYDMYAFVEKPIVVYGLAHQTAPFETVGRHKMTLEILGIPYRMGDPAATSASNWKKIINLYKDAKDAAYGNSKEISALNKEAKKLVVQAEMLESDEQDLAKGKLAYMNKELEEIALKYREIKKQVAKLKKTKKSDVKQVSIDACLELFPDAEKYILKSGRSKVKKYDDDIAEALLLAECGRTLYINGDF